MMSAVSVEVYRTLFGVDLIAEQRLVCVEVHRIGPYMLLSDLIDAFSGWDPSDFCF